MREVLLNCPLKAERRGAGAVSSLRAQPHSCRILSSGSTHLSPSTPLRQHRSGSAHVAPPCSCINFQTLQRLSGSIWCMQALCWTEASCWCSVAPLTGTALWPAPPGTTQRCAWSHQGWDSKPPAPNGSRHCYYPILQIAPRKFTVIPQLHLTSSSYPSFPK